MNTNTPQVSYIYASRVSPRFLAEITKAAQLALPAPIPLPDYISAVKAASLEGSRHGY